MSKETRAQLLSKRDLMQAYQTRFYDGTGKVSREGKLILNDLRRFCHRPSIVSFYDKEGRIDPIAMANANGRREVYDRIIRHLIMDDISEAEIEKYAQEIVGEYLT